MNTARVDFHWEGFDVAWNHVQNGGRGGEKTPNLREEKAPSRKPRQPLDKKSRKGLKRHRDRQLGVQLLLEI